MSTIYGGGPAGSPEQESNARTGAQDASSLTAGWGDPSCPTPMRMSRSHRSTGETADFWMACNRATCPVCGPALGRRHVEAFTAAFEGRYSLYLGTFTVDPSATRDLGGASGVRSYLSNTFSSVFRPRMKRRCQSGEFAYLAAAEQHASGMPHLHALMQAPIPEDVLRGQAFASGFGPSMSVRPVDPDAASVRQAVRYVLKNAFGPDRPPGVRTVWASRGIGYYGSSARDARRAFVKAQGNDRDDDIVVETTQDRIPPRRRPQGTTAEDRKRFKAARSGERRSRFLERSDDGRRGVQHVYGDGGAYHADAVLIERAGDDYDTVVVAEGVSPAEARLHLAGRLFDKGTTTLSVPSHFERDSHD